MNTTQTNPALTSENDAANEDSFFRRLYTGEGGINIVGKRKRWYQIAIAVIVVALASMLIRGFSFGIDFEGGTKMTMPPASVTTEQAEEVSPTPPASSRSWCRSSVLAKAAFWKSPQRS